MYLDHYNLNEKPFQISTDPRFLWFGEKHKEAFSVLRYGVLDNKGFLLLTGDVGTGKTTLIHALLNSLGEDVIVSTIFNPELKKLEFFNYIAHTLNFKKKYENKVDFLVDLTKFLNFAFSSNKRVLLIVDESQRLSHGLLEEIRLISNIERKDSKLINICFVAQNEFNDILWDSRNDALRQRITINYKLEPLSQKEIKDYIEHRLKVAGASRNIFKSSAIEEITVFSRGYPRLINIICDHALLTGYVKGKEKINEAIIKECAQELSIPKSTTATDDNKSRIEASKIREPEKTGKIPVDRYIFLSLLVVLFLTVLHFNYQPIPMPWSIGPLGSKQSASESGAVSIHRPVGGPVPHMQTGAKPDRIEAENAATTSGPIHSVEEAIPQSDKKIVLYFGHGSNELPDNAYPALERFAALLKSRPQAKVLVKGYTDRIGSADFNQRLSEFRANIVKGFLVGQGIDMARISVKGMGAVRSTDANPPRGSNRFDRRVEVEME